LNGGRRDFALGRVLALLSALASVALYGFRFGVGNNEFHAVIVYKIAYGLRYPGDAMAASLDNFVSPFWWLVGAVCRLVDPAAACAFFFVVGRFLFTVGLAALVGALSGERRLSAVVASVAALGPGIVAGLPLGADGLMGTSLSQTYVSPGPCLLALASAYSGRRRAAPVWLGIAYYLNAMQANFVFGLLAIVWLTEPGPLRDRLRRAVVGGLTVVLVSLPTWIWLVAIARQGAPADALSGAALADFAKFYYPDHYFWSVKTAAEKAAGLAIPAVVAILALALRRTSGDGDDGHTRPLLATAAVLLGYVVVGAIGASLWPSRFLLELHLFRSDVIAFSLAVALAAALVVRGVRASDPTLTVGGTLLLGALVSGYVLVALPLALLAFVVSAGALSDRRPDRRVAVVAPLTAATLGVLVLSQSRGTIVLLAMAAVLVFPRLTAWPVTRLTVALGIVLVCAAKWADLRPTADPGGGGRAREAEMRDLAGALRPDLREDALVAIDPAYEVRPQLGRGVFVSMKDGAAYLWKPGFEVEYLRRLALVGVSYTPGRRYDPGLVAREFQEGLPASLARLRGEGVSHAIVEADRAPAGAPCVRRSAHFCVLALRVD
jgi:hypothetical protein